MHLQAMGSCPLVFDAEEQVTEVVVVSSTSKETNLTRKRKRAAGEEYSSQKTNKTVEKRQWKKITCKCRFFSCRSISEEEIQKSFSDYWELGRLHGNMHTQKQFILQHVVKSSTKRKTGETNRRTSTFDYFLTVTGEKKRVCKAFFLGALGLGEKFVRNCVMNTSGTDTASSDKRAETSPQNFKKRVTHEQIDFIRKHIESFPAVDSHCCRANSTRLYLDAQLNLSKLYRLYLEKCVEERRRPASRKVYIKVFKTMNRSFHVPKKDQCPVCTRWNFLLPAEKEGEKANYDAHLLRAKRARELKNEIKEKINQCEEGFESAKLYNVDLQKVLETPKSEA